MTAGVCRAGVGGIFSFPIFLPRLVFNFVDSFLGLFIIIPEGDAGGAVRSITRTTSSNTHALAHNGTHTQCVCVSVEMRDIFRTRFFNRLGARELIVCDRASG